MRIMCLHGTESAATRLGHAFLGFASTELPVFFCTVCCQMKYPHNYCFYYGVTIGKAVLIVLDVAYVKHC